MKYFGIGAHKTGTTSLEAAFKILKYNCHNEYDSHKLILDYVEEYYSTLKWTSQHSDVQFYQDSPWNFKDFYKKLYFWNPKAKFILTIRNSESWFESLCNWNKNRTNKWWFSSWIHRNEYLNDTNTIFNHKDQYISIYENRNKEIKEFFKDKPNQLLILNLEDNNKWVTLCNFTKDEIPNVSYPYKNKQ
jgi:hypothetical protein